MDFSIDSGGACGHRLVVAFMGRYRNEIGIALVLAAATLAAYAPAIRADFINVDDPEYVSANRHVQAGWTAESLRWAWTTFHAGYWQPITWMSLQLDAQLFGLSPRAFHLSNLFWHVASVLLIFGLFRRLTGAMWRSAALAALFALHPMHVESVAWVTERKDVLSTFFGLLSLAAYAAYVKRPGIGRYLLVLIALSLGLMAKPMLVTWPCVLLLMDFWPLGRWNSDNRKAISGLSDSSPRKWPWLIVEKIPMFLLVAAFSAITLRAQGQVLVSLNRLPLEVRAGNAILSYVWYIAKTLWPFDLVPFYPLPAQPLSWRQVAMAAVFLFGVTAAAAAMARRRPYLLVGWLWFLGTLVPVIGLMQAGEQGRADRFVYLPHIGLFIFVIWGLHDSLAAFRISEIVPIISSAIIFGALGILTFLQAGYWHDSITLWEYAIRVNPENSMAHSYLGAALLNQGKGGKAFTHLHEAVRLDPANAQAQFNLGVILERQGQFGEAAEHYLAALRIKPNNAFAHANLGAVLVKENKEDEAAPHFAEALRLDPNMAPAQFNWGVASMKQGKNDEAIQHFEDALNLDPNLAMAHLNLSLLFATAGRLDAAIEHARDAVRIAPSELGFYQLGRELARREKWDGAVAAFRQGVDLDPYSLRSRCSLAWAFFHLGQTGAARANYAEAFRIDPNWPQLANRRARLLCTHPEAKERDVHLALELAEQICQATDNREAVFLDTLAAAQANAGRFEQAVSTAKQAMSIAAAAKQSDLATEIQKRMRRYESGQPYREPPAAGRP